MFGLFKKKKDSVEIKSNYPELMGLRLGGSVRLDDLTLKILETNGLLDGPRREQMIEAVGVAVMDDDFTIVRYYTNDEGFIQVNVHGDMHDRNVSDIFLWYYSNSKGMGTQQAWEEALQGASKPTWQYEGFEYQRIWNDEGETLLQALSEKGEQTDGDKFEVDQFFMIYERQIAEPDVFELLMINGEEKEMPNGELDRTMVTSIGYKLSQNDLHVIS